MKITLPLPPNMANSRTHWRVKNKQRKEYFATCAAMTWMQRHHANWTTHKCTKVRATIYCGGRMDQDNALSRLKWPADFLVTAGFVMGDNPDQLVWDWPITQIVKRNQEYRVEFELESAA